MKTMVIILLAILAVGVAGTSIYYFNSKNTLINQNPVNEEVMDNDQTMEPEETNEVMISQAMADKYNKDVSEVNLSVQKMEEPYAQGLINFEGEMGGGWWLAYKEDTDWVIVADGNGTVMCDDVEPYGFPTDMVSSCWDETAQELVQF